ncbi:hypothetical protein SLI_2780 [Streptomyces lividans 1326]|uniref:Uncharacterized protein n=1 Tax=Streptomyces lividans 1326 TaxID=1200984 RepID=A0A7U9DSD0_STRLI|nr:hypothetical protein SLI_2780 [Streptomyces lividans 1326]
MDEAGEDVGEKVHDRAAPCAVQVRDPPGPAGTTRDMCVNYGLQPVACTP